jgi:hypothetical protein
MQYCDSVIPIKIHLEKNEYGMFEESPNVLIDSNARVDSSKES